MSVSLQPLFTYTGVVIKPTVDAGGPAAGPGLAIVEEFLNTLDERSFSRRGTRHTGGEELSSPAALSAWLAARDMVPAGSQVSPADLARARAVRGALRSALLQRAGSGAGQFALTRSNLALESIPLRVEFGPDGTPHLSAASHDAAGAGTGGAGASAGAGEALAAIAAAVALSQASGTWQRLKMCAAEDCRWVFFDGSRSGGGRWCSMSACGNRDKTRAYRQRARTAIMADRR